jgi:Flp pilus assembly protein TadG
MKALRAMQDRGVSKSSHSAAGKGGILRSASGQALVELALVTPLLLALAMGVMELGRYAYISIIVGNAARAGAAFGAQSLPQSADTTGIQAAANSDFQDNGQNTSALTVSSSTSCGCDSGGTVTAAACTGSGSGTCASGHWVVMVSVEAKGTFNSMFNYPGIPQSITVDMTCTMRVAQQ